MTSATYRTLWIILLIAVILSLGFAIRIYQLDTFPPGLYNDEAAYAMDGLSVLHGEYAVFFERNNGREPLFIYLLALVFHFLGATAYTVRLTAALVGALTVGVTYWMVRELFRFAPNGQSMSPRWFAAWAALLLAFSYWHLSFSRLGFRAITLPLLTTITFALLWRAWGALRTPRSLAPRSLPLVPAILGGAALGLTFYTYTAGRMAIGLFLATVALALLLAPRFEIERRRLLVTATISLLTAALVVMPLLFYFMLHPAYFAEHAADVSIFNPKYSAGNPVGAFFNSLTKTLLMFLSAADPNLRHNPARIPVFDPLLAIWLALGLIVTAVTWRKLITAFSLFWFVLFLVPAVLSAEGAPHSLRAIGLLPIVYVLPLFAMDWVISLTPSRWRRIMRWLPAPFLLISAVVALTSYFGAWNPIDRFRPAFFIDFANLAYAIEQPDAPQGLWVLPLPTTEDLTDGKLNTVDFLLKKPDKYTTLALNEETITQELTRLTANHDRVFVLQTMGLPEHRRFQTKFADTKGLLAMLLRRNSKGPAVEGGTVAGIPYSTYELVDQPTFALPAAEQPASVTFGEAIRLTAINLGAGNDRQLDQSGILALSSDEPLWGLLRWQALEPITATLKTSLVLADEAGNWVGQVDGFLGGNRYPLAANWFADEQASTYHLMEMIPALAPGRYTLTLRVYEDESGRIYPIQTPAGESVALTLATIDLLSPRQPGAIVTPQFLPVAPMATGDLEFLGHDLPATTIAPGDNLPLTLYFRSPITPTTDYTLQATLNNAEGAVVAQQLAPVGGDHFPTSAWRSGEVMRTPLTLRTDPDLPNGQYGLTLALLANTAVQAESALATVEVSGRPRLLIAPSVALPMTATFGDSIQLLGVDAPASLTVTPSSILTLTLLWQPLKSEPRNLIRFTQLLSEDNQLAAQQDTVPCERTCPATSWLAGEYLVDTATLTLPDVLPAGDYRLITGWYDEDTQQRLEAFDADGQIMPDHVALLPVTITVID